MSYIVLTRDPMSRKLLILRHGQGDDGRNDLHEFDSEVAAHSLALRTVCKEWGYEVVRVDVQ